MKDDRLSNLTWCNAVSDIVKIKEVLDFIRSKNKNGHEFHVGCDSHYVKEKCVFALVIAIYEPKKGGTYFFARKKVPRKTLQNMKIRLLKETEFAIALADLLSASVSIDDIYVHLDINPNKRFKSSQVFTSATSWVKSQGYSCVVKPDSWASSWLADAYAK